MTLVGDGTVSIRYGEQRMLLQAERHSGLVGGEWYTVAKHVVSVSSLSR